MYLKIILFSTLISLLTITFLKIDNVQRQIIVFLAFLIFFIIFTKTFRVMIDKNTINNTINDVLENDITTGVNGNGVNGNYCQCGCQEGGKCSCGKGNGGKCSCGCQEGGKCSCGKGNGGKCSCGKGNGGKCSGGCQEGGKCSCGKGNGGKGNGGKGCQCGCQEGGNCPCQDRLNKVNKVTSNLHEIAPNDYPPVNCSQKDCNNYNFNYNDLIDERDSNDYTLDEIIPNKNYNQRDCMNDHSCVIKPDQCNMFPN